MEAIAPGEVVSYAYALYSLIFVSGRIVPGVTPVNNFPTIIVEINA